MTPKEFQINENPSKLTCKRPKLLLIGLSKSKYNKNVTQSVWLRGCIVFATLFLSENSLNNQTINSEAGKPFF